MKRILAAALALIMIATVLAACSKKPEEKAVDPAKPAEKKVYKINYWQHAPWTRAAYPGKDQDWMVKYILEKYGLDINLQIAPADGADAKLNAMIAGGDIPDLIQGYFTVASTAFTQWVQQGVIMPVDPYLKEFPKLNTLLNERQWQYLSMDGKKWGVAPYSDKNFDTIWIRQDWLDKLNLKAPTTTEELAKVALAFATQDPDGNGKPDTYGLTSHTNTNVLMSRVDSFFAPFGAMPGSNQMYIENNQVVFSALSDNMKNALTWMNGLVKAKAIDPDWMTNKNENWRQSVAQGRVGMVTGQFQFTRESACSDCLGMEIKAANPNAKWVMLPAIKGSKGAYSAWEKTPVGNTFHLTRKATDDPEKAKAIMKFLQDALDDKTELYDMLVWGKPGEQIEMKDGKKWARMVLPPEQQWLGYWRNWRLGTDEYWQVSWRKETPADLLDKYKFTAAQPVITRYENMLKPHDATADMLSYMREMHAKFALGEEPMSNWDKYVQTVMTKYRGKEIMDDATAQLKKLGLIK